MRAVCVSVSTSLRAKLDHCFLRGSPGLSTAAHRKRTLRMKLTDARTTRGKKAPLYVSAVTLN